MSRSRGETNSLCQSVRQFRHGIGWPPWRTTDKSVNHQLKFLVHEYYRVRQVVLEFMQARQDHSYYYSDRVGPVQIKRINQTQRMILVTTSPFDAVKKEAEEVEQIRAIKEDKVLIKPFRFSQLLSLIITMIMN